MTLAEFQPHVEKAVTALEWTIARARRTLALAEEAEAIMKALPLAGSYGVERAPLEGRLEQIACEIGQGVTADMVSQHPVRSIPMDVITAAVVRRTLHIPADFPVLSVKTIPSPEAIADAVMAIAARWHSPQGPIAVDD
jgi:hypothetical protein